MNFKIIGTLILLSTSFTTQAGGLMRCEASGKTVEYVQKQLQGYRCVAIKDAPPPPTRPYIPQIKSRDSNNSTDTSVSIFKDMPMTGMPIPPSLLPSDNATAIPPIFNSSILPPKNLPLPSDND